MTNSIEAYEAKGNVHILVEDDAKVLFKHEILTSVVLKYIPRENPLVLDVGCGMGQLTAEIQKSRPDCTFDLADAYQVCLDKSQERMGGGDTFIIGEKSFDLSEIPNDTYDVVILSHVLEHLRNPVDAVEDLMTKVKKGGVAIIAVPNLARPETLALALLKRHYVNRGHVCGWDRSHWRNFLENILGLDVIEYPDDFMKFPYHDRSLMKPVSRALGRMFPHWGFENIAVIRKH